MARDEAIVNPQTGIPGDLVPPLDPELFQPTPEALEFLKESIDQDEERMLPGLRRRKIKHSAPSSLAEPCAFHTVDADGIQVQNTPTPASLGKSVPKAILLDIGCCMGTDVRKAAFDGCPASQIVGCDLLPDFLALGPKLYSDTETCPIRFIQGDLFAFDFPSPGQSVTTTSTPIAEVVSLTDLLGRVAVVYTGALFHL